MNASSERLSRRRRFLNFLLGTSWGALLVAILHPIIKFLSPPPSVESSQSSVVAGTVKEFHPNSGKIFKFGGKPGILIQTPAGEFRAFSAICTHLGCIVQYRPDLRHIWCACHNGHYDLYGRNIAGPPPRPLERYQVNIRGDEIIVAKG